MKRRLYLSEEELILLKAHLERGADRTTKQLLKRVECLIDSNDRRKNKVYEPLEPIVDDIPF